MKYKWLTDNHQKYFATTDDKKRIVTINRKKNKASGKGELADTILHEKQHIAHPMAKEKTIQGLTKKTMKKLSSKSKHKLYSKVDTGKEYMKKAWYGTPSKGAKMGLSQMGGH